MTNHLANTSRLKSFIIKASPLACHRRLKHEHRAQIIVSECHKKRTHRLNAEVNWFSLIDSIAILMILLNTAVAAVLISPLMWLITTAVAIGYVMEYPVHRKKYRAYLIQEIENIMKSHPAPLNHNLKAKKQIKKAILINQKPLSQGAFGMAMHS